MRLSYFCTARWRKRPSRSSQKLTATAAARLLDGELAGPQEIRAGSAGLIADDDLVDEPMCAAILVESTFPQAPDRLDSLDGCARAGLFVRK